MALQALADSLGSPLMVCLAHCSQRDYNELIVTKCNHVFCRDCLKVCLEKKPVCPIDNGPLPSMTAEEGKKEYTPFLFYLERFTYYIQNDFSTLKEKLTAVKTQSIGKCRLLKIKKNKSEDHCPICFEIPFQIYFITQDKDPKKIGRHMHEDCWQSTVDDDSDLLGINVQDLIKVAQKLLPAPKQPDPKPTQPPSPIKFFFMVSIISMSGWALATNSRIYHNKNSLLYVLSIPALVVFTLFSLLFNGIKSIFSDKSAHSTSMK